MGPSLTSSLRLQLAFTGLLGFIAPSSSGCEHQAHATTHQAQVVSAYPVASAAVADAVVRHEYVAEVRAARYAEIRARVGGIIEELGVDEGQHVEAGQRLFSIGARHLLQDVAAAKAAAAVTDAELAAARLELENTQLLFDKSVVSAAPLGQAKAKVDALEAKLRELKASAGRAKVQVGYARIDAPFSGRVDQIPNRVGSVIAEEELLTTIADTHEVYAYFRMSELDYLRQQGALQGDKPAEVRLKLADGSMVSRPGIIDAVGNEIDRETGTITLRARFANEDGALKHGSSGKVVLETKIPQAILVPQASTVDVQGNLFVYVVDQDDVVHAQKIVARARLDQDFVVETGLTPDDRFVVEGVQRLRDGDEIRVVPPAAAES